jgi:hypothetical protein
LNTLPPHPHPHPPTGLRYVPVNAIPPPPPPPFNQPVYPVAPQYYHSIYTPSPPPNPPTYLPHGLT